MENPFNCMAIVEETFNEIKVLGICRVLGCTKEDGFEVELYDHKIMHCDSVVPLYKWQEYVDSREAKVTNILES